MLSTSWGKTHRSGIPECTWYIKRSLVTTRAEFKNLTDMEKPASRSFWLSPVDQYELVRDFYSKKLKVAGTLNPLKCISKVAS